MIMYILTDFMKVAEFVKYGSNKVPGRFSHGLFRNESFRPWVVWTGSFRPGSYQPDLRVGGFGLFRWVVSALYTPTPPHPIFYNINETAHNDNFSL